MISLQQLTLRRGQSVLLQQADAIIYPKQRVGLIGANGCGKTSLFSMLLGNLQPEMGEYSITRQLVISHVAQETPALQCSALDYVLDGDQELRTLESKLKIAEEQDDGHQIAVVHDQLATIQAYSAPARAAQLLNGLGFSEEEQGKLVSEFSGGWRVRLNLGKALMCRSDILLLDEPTNHLDLDAILWLEQWLKHYSGTLLIISHDRDFLDRTIDYVMHIEHKRIQMYTGNYSSFEKQRAEQLTLQQATYEKQQKHLAHMQSFVNRFKAKASKAKQAQSRVKAIERMVLVSAVHVDSPFQFHFDKPKVCPHPLITIDDATIAYGEKSILSKLNMSLAPKDRIAILGPNGAGKSSFIKLLANEIKPAIGSVNVSSGVTIGYFAQHQVDALSLEESPLDHLKNQWPTESELSLRTFLGTFGFSGDSVFAAVKTFSGGEKSRLALAIIVKQAPSLLLLDEPTNHLDMEMRHALSMALQDYEGAMILVSHDRFLLRSTTDQYWLAARGELTSFAGDLQDYETWLFEYRKQEASLTSSSVNSTLSKKEVRQREREARDKERALLLEVKKLERQIEETQLLLAAINEQLIEPSIFQPEQKSKLQALLLDEAKYKKRLVTLENDWLAAKCPPGS